MTPCDTCSRRDDCGHEPPAPDRCPDWIPEKPLSFRFIRATDITPTSTQWIAKGYIPADSLVTLFAPPESYKSFIGLDLACATATGEPFMGMIPIVTSGPVLYLAAEGQQGLARRRRAWEIDRGVRPERLYFSSAPARLTDPEFMATVTDAAEAVAITDAPPVLVVIDTWARSLAGDENSTLDASTAVAALDALRARWRATVLVIHHQGWKQPGKPDRVRGSSALHGADDCEFSLPVKDGIGTLTPGKTKDSERAEPIAFRLRNVSLPELVNDDGTLEHSAVVDVCDAPAARPDAVPAADLAVLELLRQHPAGLTAKEIAAGLGPMPDGRTRTDDAARAACNRLLARGLTGKTGHLWSLARNDPELIEDDPF